MSVAKINRRQFIQSTLIAGGGLAASHLMGCSTIDRWFGIEKKKYEDEVLIIGGGIAGLAAAFELKRQGVPYRIFEASSRIGGRIYTIENFNADRQFVELGAEYFHLRHHSLFELCRELKIEIEKIEEEKHLEPQLYLAQGKILGQKEIMEKLKPLSARFNQLQHELFADRAAEFNFHNRDQYPLAKKYDLISLKDLIYDKKLNLENDLVKIFETICVSQFGVEAANLSCLHLMQGMALEENAKSLSDRTFYRVKGGNGALIRALYDRVSGVVPDYLVKLNYPLVGLSEKAGYFQCHFQGTFGYEQIEARRIICTIPINHLRQVDGLAKLKLAPAKLEAIRRIDLANHSKAMVSFKNKFWLNKNEVTRLSQGTLLGGVKSQAIWDSSRQQSGKRGILSFQCGGELGLRAGYDYIEQAINDLQPLTKNALALAEGHQQVMNWTQRKWSRGSKVYYRPGEFMIHNGVLREPEYDNRLCFAGEHVHFRDHGSISGAIESGKTAAQRMVTGKA